MAYRLGVDVGGTFTDLFLVDDDRAKQWRVKTPSTPRDPSDGVLTGVERICAEAGIAPGDLRNLVHGTTVATNAVLEGKGARVGLVTTQGFGQILHLARSQTPGPLAGWIIMLKPDPPASLADTREAVERMDARGETLVPIDREQVRAVVEDLIASGVESLTISLVNSYVDGRHEREIAAIVEEVRPGFPVTISSDVLPEFREYERTLTACMNSYVRPTVADYVGRLRTRLHDLGTGGDLNILRSDAGVMTPSEAARNPVYGVLSGPSGGVAGALHVAARAGHPNILTFDMGGTSTDVSLCRGGEPTIGRETTVGQFKIKVPSVDVRTVGAGGGSIAHVPELTKALRVGPQSAGAEPGPAAYGKGGEAPTVTDANVVLGYLPPSLVGGEMTLDVDAARASVQTIADAMGLADAETAAAGIVDIVNENMFGALRLVSVQQGYDPRDFALVAFGGAGPLHANALARLLGSWPVIVPPSPGVLCAYGDATTSLRDEGGRTFIRRFSETSDAEVRTELADLAGEVQARLEADGVPRGEQTVAYQVDVRYHGQGFEVPVDVSLDQFDGDGLAVAGRAFNAEHDRLFTFALDAEHELVNLRAAVTGRPPQISAPPVAEGGTDPSAAHRGDTKVYVDGAWTEAQLYDRTALAAGNVVAGPAVITEMDSTTLVLPGYAGTVDSVGSILIRPASAGA